MPATLPRSAATDRNHGPILWRYPGLSAYLGRSVKTLERDNARGLLPRPITIGGSVYWSKNEIDQWLQAGAPPRSEWDAMKASQNGGGCGS